jgi:CheY-like chemotaxis protein
MEPFVLVVDDNRDDRQILATFLRYFGYEVADAPDGPTALKRARERPPDAAVFDLAMPGVSGTDLAAAFRAEPALARVPLIAVSAHPEYRTLAVRAGFDAFLQKPCDPADLAATLRRLLEPPPPPTTIVTPDTAD